MPQAIRPRKYDPLLAIFPRIFPPSPLTIFRRKYGRGAIFFWGGGIFPVTPASLKRTVRSIPDRGPTVDDFFLNFSLLELSTISTRD